MTAVAERTKTTALATRSTALAERQDVVGLLTFEDLFEATPLDSVASLLAEYSVERARVERIAAIFSDAADRRAVEHFLDAAKGDRGYIPSPSDIFQLKPALGVLDARYWSRLIKTTDVYEAMPQTRRDAWNEQISKRTAPPFDETTVLVSMSQWLSDRKLYFAEKVDGVFRALSPDHKTNKASGFSKRMILTHVYSWHAEARMTGFIHDLREVIAKFMGRSPPLHWTTSTIVEHARREHYAEWVSVDGGSFKIRVYKNGNGHLEVHPEIAWRLNNVLASIYPNAIASEHRQRPRKQRKDWPLYSRPLPFPVLAMIKLGDIAKPRTREDVLARWNDHHRYEGQPSPEKIAALTHDTWRFSFHYSDDSTGPVREEACRVLESVGGTRGVRSGKGGARVVDVFEFTFDPHEVLRHVFVTGCLPDQVAHQFYPTPPALAARVVHEAEIGPEHTVLEPSAGQGGLADLLPRERTVCVEVSELHAKVLLAKGHKVHHADFLRWRCAPVDRVVMNPPFSDGRWLEHVEHAASLVKDDGRLVAVLPASARNRKGLLDGWRLSWSENFEGEFAGTGAIVVILVAERR